MKLGKGNPRAFSPDTYNLVEFLYPTRFQIERIRPLHRASDFDAARHLQHNVIIIGSGWAAIPALVLLIVLARSE
jgi:hypothetical protein